MGIRAVAWGVKRSKALAICAPLAALMLTLWAVGANGEDVPLYSCARGKPHYCLKYGQGICRKHNSLPDAAAACEQWIQECIECQTAIANCFERSAEPVFDGSAECTACRAEMQACMTLADKQYWPNRQ